MRGEKRVAVIGEITTDDKALAGLTSQMPVVQRHLERRLHRIRTGRTEMKTLILLRRDGSHLGAQGGGPRVRSAAEAMRIGQLLHGLASGPHQALISIADIGAPRTRHRIDDFTPVSGVNVNALGSTDQGRTYSGKLHRIGVA